MDGVELALVAVLVLAGYTVGYWLGRSDERRLTRRRNVLVGRARDREWQQTLGEPGSPR